MLQGKHLKEILRFSCKGRASSEEAARLAPCSNSMIDRSAVILEAWTPKFLRSTIGTTAACRARKL